MAIDNPPPPVKVERSGKGSGAPIADMREAFDRKTPQTEQNRVEAKAFIDGKIEMIRRDPHMTEAQKAAAIADLEARRKAE
jgi:hypothetical protein